MSEEKIVYNVGDLVQLRCGGPAMVVLQPECPESDYYKGKAQVTWFNGHSREIGYFDHRVICPYGQAIKHMVSHVKVEDAPRGKKIELFVDLGLPNAKSSLKEEVPFASIAGKLIGKSEPPLAKAAVETGAMTTCSKHGIAHQISKGCHYCCED